MNKPILIDTHIWIWYLMGSVELSKNIQQLITSSLQNQQAHLAAISLWEISMLDKKRRIILDMPCLSWIHKFIELTHIKILPLTVEIAVESCNLPDQFHPDPADRMITATARIENLTLITRDERILDYGNQSYVLTLSA
ncbi:MAG: type II toxin-antitoxin system VapC family toxin [Gammaproteobacteria bacterium]